MEINYMGPRLMKEIVIRYFLVKEDHQKKKKKGTAKKKRQLEDLGSSPLMITTNKNVATSQQMR